MVQRTWMTPNQEQNYDIGKDGCPRSQQIKENTKAIANNAYGYSKDGCQESRWMKVKKKRLMRKENTIGMDDNGQSKDGWQISGRMKVNKQRLMIVIQY